MMVLLAGPGVEEMTAFHAGSSGGCMGRCYVGSEEVKCMPLSTHSVVGMMSGELARYSR